MNPTHEQEAFLQKPVRAAIIKALAGTGKTTLFRMFAQRYPELRILYLSYNRSIVDEANLPGNCLALSSHQLAYKFVGYRYSSKMSDNLNMGLIKSILKISWAEASQTKMALEKFLYSQEKTICEKHITESPRNRKSKSNKAEIVKLARIVWKGMCELDGPFPMTHDGYLKGYALADIDLSSYFDVLLVDEGQDTNPAVMTILDAQKTMKKYICGDDSQQLYRYRSAQNALSLVENEKVETFALTKSFRFNDEVAEFANHFLRHLKVEERLTGTENNVEQSILNDPQVLDSNLPTAYINRTILKTIELAIEHLNEGRSVMWVGGMQNYPFVEVLDVLRLKLGQRNKIKSRDILRDYKDFESYQFAAKATGSLDMARILRIIKKYDTALFDIYTNLKNSEVKEISKAMTIVTTCHRSKGLEFPQVVLGNDFKDLKALLRRPEEEIRDELNLMYVGITRAMKRLVPSDPFIEMSKQTVNVLDQRASVMNGKKRRGSKRHIQKAA